MKSKALRRLNNIAILFIFASLFMFMKIRSAEAATYNSYDINGNHIVISEEMYLSEVIIITSDTTIESNGTFQWISGGNITTSGPTSSGAMFVVNSGKLTLKNVGLDGHLNSEITHNIAINGGEVIIENCYVQNAYKHGVTISGAGKLTATNTYFQNNDQSGIRADGGTVTLNRCYIRDNGYNPGGSDAGGYGYPGIQVASQVTGTINNCSISGNAGQGITSNCATVLGGVTLTVNSSQIRDNGLSGLYTIGPHTITLNSCTVSGNNEFGLNLRGTGTVYSNSTVITDNSSSGCEVAMENLLYLDDYNDNGVKSSIYGNGGNGIVIADQGLVKAWSVDIGTNDGGTSVVVYDECDRATPLILHEASTSISQKIDLYAAGCYIETDSSSFAQTLKVWVQEANDQRKIVQSNNTSTYSYVSIVNDNVKKYASGNNTHICAGHNVTVNAGSNISSVTGGKTYYYGDTVSISANPNTGYTFKGWDNSDADSDINTTTNRYSWTMGHTGEAMTAYAHDITAPSVTLSQNPTDWTNGNVTLTATASDNGSGLHSSGAYKWNSGSYGISTTYIATTNGTYTVTVRDNDGNTATASITVTNIDKINPAFNIGAVKSGTTASITSGTWYNTNITVNATSIDDGAATTSYGKSGLHSSYIKWDTSGSYGSYGTSTSQTITVADGSTYNRIVKATVRDAVGNYVEKTFTVKIDKAKPIVTLSQNPTAWTNGNVTLTATASDNGSGLHSQAYSWDNGSTWTVSNTKTVTTNGTYTVKVRDALGNTSSASITVANIDKLLPNLNLSGKANGASIATNIWTKYDVTITETHSDQAATADYGQSNFNTNYIKWANPTYGSYGSSTSVTVSTSNGTVLERNVQATVQDKAGNETSASFYVKIDKQAPTVTLTQNPTAWTNEDVTLTVTANDGAGIGLNSKPYKWFSDTAFNTTTQVTVTKNGTYSIQVRDKLGNTATASIEVTNIDKLSPNITGLEAFATISEIDRNEGKQTVTVTLTDPSNTDYGASGIKGGTLTVTNSDNNLSKTWTISDTGIIEIDITDDTTKELSELFYGNFRVTVNAEDNVGNTSTKYIDTTEFTLDTELIHADNYKSSLFIKGETGLFIFYAGGYPDEVKVYFPTDAGLDQDYSTVFYYTKQKAIETGVVPFYVPLDAIEGDYTIYVESYKNGKLLQTKSQAFQITEETILDRLQTQLSR